LGGKIAHDSVADNLSAGAGAVNAASPTRALEGSFIVENSIIGDQRAAPLYGYSTAIAISAQAGGGNIPVQAGADGNPTTKESCGERGEASHKYRRRSPNLSCRFLRWLYSSVSSCHPA
jgi:hypothetical protein